MAIGFGVCGLGFVDGVMDRGFMIRIKCCLKGSISVRVTVRVIGLMVHDLGLEGPTFRTPKPETLQGATSQASNALNSEA